MAIPGYKSWTMATVVCLCYKDSRTMPNSALAGIATKFLGSYIMAVTMSTSQIVDV